jgi:tagatose 6-phosphate kinase
MGYILTVTLNAAIDTTLTLASPFIIGHLNRAQAALKLPGGKGINVARVLHTLGIPAHVTGFAGGPAAAFLNTELARAGISATFQPIAGNTRTCTAIVELENHRVTEVNEPGPTITEAEAQRFLELYSTLLQDAAAVVLSGSLPPGIPGNYYATLIACAHAAGVPAILDTSGQALAAGITARPLLVKPNIHEVRDLLSREIRTLEEAVHAGQQLRARGAQVVIITLGAQGTVLILENAAWHAQVQVAHPISSVGCGDALLAGFLAALQQAEQRGETPSLHAAATDPRLAPQALRLAVACGAANTLHLGAGIIMPQEVEQLRDLAEITALT